MGVGVGKKGIRGRGESNIDGIEMETVEITEGREKLTVMKYRWTEGIREEGET